MGYKFSTLTCLSWCLHCMNYLHRWQITIVLIGWIQFVASNFTTFFLCQKLLWGLNWHNFFLANGLDQTNQPEFLFSLLAKLKKKEIAWCTGLMCNVLLNVSGLHMKWFVRIISHLPMHALSNCILKDYNGAPCERIYH